MLEAYRIETSRGVGIRLLTKFALIGATLVVEKIFLNSLVDSDRAQAATGLSGAIRVTQHWALPCMLASLAVVILLARVREDAEIRSALRELQDSAFRVRWAMLHVGAVLMLAPLSFWLYRNDVSPLPSVLVAVLWLAIGVGAIGSILLSAAQMGTWRRVLHSLGAIWVYGAAAGLLGIGAIRVSQHLWHSLATVTFFLVRWVLNSLIPDLTADSSTHILSTDNFAIEVTEVCSGLEGMGLTLAFCGAWLIYFRREYVMPRALILIPAGIVAIFILNILRIATLMLIGVAGHPNVAALGFHSQAGWISFISVACGVVYVGHRSTWLHRPVGDRFKIAVENPVAAYLAPLLGILAAGMLSKALAGDFETLYPLRFIAGVLLLGYYRRTWVRLGWKFRWSPVLVGLLVGFAWIVAIRWFRLTATFRDDLGSMQPTVRALWVIAYAAASVVTTPLAQEIAYRGYLMRRLVNVNFEAVRFRDIRWVPIVAAALAFGVLQGSLWPFGVISGIAYGILVVRGDSLGDGIIAHAVCNMTVTVASFLG